MSTRKEARPLAKKSAVVMSRAHPFDALVAQDARVFKTGNSLAVRVPSALAKQIGLEDGTPIEIAADHDTMYIRRAPARTLNELLERITPENMHEPSFDPIGNERW